MNNQPFAGAIGTSSIPSETQQPLPTGGLSRLKKILFHAELWLTGAFVVLVCFGPIRSPDFWWQLAEGQEIFATRSLAGNPPRAFGLPSDLNEYAIYDLVIALAHRAVGMGGLRVLFGTLNVLPFALVAGLWLRRRNDLRFSYWLVGTAAFGLLFVRLQQRPEILGNALLVGLGLLLLKNTNAHLRRIHYPVVGGLLCLWTNFHSSFIVGLGILCLWAVETLWEHRRSDKFRQRLWRTTCLITVAILGAMLNPNGSSRLWAPLSLQTNFWSAAVTAEMWPLQLHFYWLILGIAVIGIYVWFSSAAATRPLWLLLLLIAMVALALISNRHINLVGCALLLILAFRLKSDSALSEPDNCKPWLIISQIVVSLALIVITTLLLGRHGFQEIKRWQEHGWAINDKAYAAHALAELHRHQPEGASFLAGMFDSAYAYATPPYKLRPLMDTGLSRFTDETVKYFFHLDNHPGALRLALDQLDSNYTVLNLQNSHWATVLNGAPGWSLIFVSGQGLLYKRQANAGGASEALKDAVKSMARQLEEKEKTSAGIYYTMNLLAPEITLGILRESSNAWWKEPNVNFMREWLAGVPAETLEKFTAGLSADTPSRLRLKILLALRLGLIEEAEHLSRSLMRMDLEDAVLRAEVLLATKEPCVAQNILKGIFPVRRWSVRLADVAYRTRQICALESDKSALSSNWREILWSDELETWMQEMSNRLNRNMVPAAVSLQ